MFVSQATWEIHIFQPKVQEDRQFQEFTKIDHRFWMIRSMDDYAPLSHDDLMAGHWFPLIRPRGGA